MTIRYDTIRDGIFTLRSIKSRRKGQLYLAHGTRNGKNKEKTKTEHKDRVAQDKRSGYSDSP